MHDYYSGKSPYCQYADKYILHDISKDGSERPWAVKKMKNELLSTAYLAIDRAKAARLQNCCTALIYDIDAAGKQSLAGMNSCRVRLCPMCTWRKSLRVYADTAKITAEAKRRYDYDYIFVTLTVRNCAGTDLEQSINTLLRGFARYLKNTRIKNVVRGYYRSLEITHDVNDRITREMYKTRSDYYKLHGYTVGMVNPQYDMYHPHIHALFAVQRSYFHSRDYISRADFAAMWQSAAMLDYIPQVDVRRAKDNKDRNTVEAVAAEISKYACKDSDYIVPDDWDLTVETVRLLDRVLDGRRLIAYGGTLMQLKKELKIADIDNADLVHIEADEATSDVVRQVYYYWQSGYNQYMCE